MLVNHALKLLDIGTGMFYECWRRRWNGMSGHGDGECVPRRVLIGTINGPEHVVR
jgi:hypothetical protein